MSEPHDILDAIETRARPREAAERPARRWSPPARPTSRSIRCATSPTAPPASRATPSPRALAELGAETLLVSGPTREAGPGRRRGAPCRDRGARCWRRARRRCRSTSRCAPPRSPIGARRGPATRSSRRTARPRQSLELAANPDILAHARAVQDGAAAPGGRLRGRDRAGGQARRGEAEEEGLRLDPRQRRVGPAPAPSAAMPTPSTSSPRSGVEDWPTLEQAGRGATPRRAASPIICEARMPEAGDPGARCSACRMAPTCRCRPMRPRSRPGST